MSAGVRLLFEPECIALLSPALNPSVALVNARLEPPDLASEFGGGSGGAGAPDDGTFHSRSSARKSAIAKSSGESVDSRDMVPSLLLKLSDLALEVCSSLVSLGGVPARTLSLSIGTGRRCQDFNLTQIRVHETVSRRDRKDNRQERDYASDWPYPSLADQEYDCYRKVASLTGARGAGVPTRVPPPQNKLVAADAGSNRMYEFIPRSADQKFEETKIRGEKALKGA